MEVNFDRQTISCLDTALQQVQNSEQTLELKLQEGMPDVGRILTAWGQPILRSKEWREDQVQFSGGMMVWVLYAPEDGSEEQCVQGWIPFQMRWELPENCPEGTLRLRCLTRFVDGRSTSPRKILVRAGLAAMAEAFVPVEILTAQPGEGQKQVPLLEHTYPVRLLKEAGEKAFLMEEELYLPDSAPKIRQLISWRVTPRITEHRVLADKVVFKGNGNLHVLYRSDAGQLHDWDFELPFSQYADLRGEYGGDARVETAIMPTSLEVELRENGNLDIRGGMTAQYLISDKQSITLVEDAYSPVWDLTVRQEDITPPVVLENRRENISGEQTIAVDANLTADVQFLPDFPRQRRQENGVEIEYPGQFQVLFYDGDGRLQGTTCRWEGNMGLPSDENSRIAAVPVGAEAQAITGSGKILVKVELPVDLTTTVKCPLPMVTGVTLGERKQPDSNRPSLILRRAGHSSLWEIAKTTGSTMEDIRRANNLTGEPTPGQMLLIPVP